MRSAPLLLASLVLLTLSGCAALYATADHPESLDPVPVEASLQRTYEAAVSLAFDRGYNIRYTSERDYLIELDRLDRAFFQPPIVRRLDLLVQERGGRTYLHARYFSFPVGRPAEIAVQEEGRKMARAFVDALVERLRERQPAER